MDAVVVQPRLARFDPPSVQEAWEMVTTQLRLEMPQVNYATWIQPLRPVSFKEGVFRVGAANSMCRDWVTTRMSKRITRLLEVTLNQKVSLRVAVMFGDVEVGQANALAAAERLPAAAMEQPAAESLPVELPLAGETPAAGEPALLKAQGPESQPEPASGNPPEKVGRVSERKKKAGPEETDIDEGGSPRKIQLQRAYGTPRARVIQPERGMFMTMYFFNQWLPLLGHSALVTVLAARSLCYWNPMTGELRNVIETEMSELASRADISVRTIKDVLNNPLVKRYFLRYKVRRTMTPNGVRTAGIILQVRMDDPLTPEDQDQHNLPEEERWYTADFEDETEE